MYFRDYSGPYRNGVGNYSFSCFIKVKSEEGPPFIGIKGPIINVGVGIERC